MNNKNKIYVIAASLLAIILLLVLLAITPLVMQIRDNSKKLVSVSNDMAVLKIQDDSIKSFKGNYQTYQGDLQMINQSFIDGQNPVDVIKFIENSANDSGISLQTSLTSDPAKTGQDHITFQLFSSADFLNIMQFAKELETGPYLLSIQNMTLKEVQDSTPARKYIPGKVDAAFIVNVFTK